MSEGLLKRPPTPSRVPRETTFETVEDAQKALCPPYRTVQPDGSVKSRYDRLYGHWRKLYFSLGAPGSDAVSVGGILPDLRAIAAEARR
jgi:L-ribulokinase